MAMHVPSPRVPLPTLLSHERLLHRSDIEDFCSDVGTSFFKIRAAAQIEEATALRTLESNPKLWPDMEQVANVDCGGCEHPGSVAPHTTVFKASSSLDILRGKSLSFLRSSCRDQEIANESPSSFQDEDGL